MSFLCEEEPPLSDQLPGEHTGQGLQYLGFPVSVMNLLGMHIFHLSPSSARYSFYGPMEGWKAESTCRQWGSNSPPFAQESDVLLSCTLKCTIQFSLEFQSNDTRRQISYIDPTRELSCLIHEISFIKISSRMGHPSKLLLQCGVYDNPHTLLMFREGSRALISSVTTLTVSYIP